MWSSAKIFWNVPTSLSGPVRSHEARPNIASFSWVDPYNHATTRKPIIWQFCKNAHSVISFLLMFEYTMEQTYCHSCVSRSPGNTDEMAGFPLLRPCSGQVSREWHLCSCLYSNVPFNLQESIDVFCEKAYDLGSDTVEGTCKNMVGKRLKQSGIIWTRFWLFINADESRYIGLATGTFVFFDRE